MTLTHHNILNNGYFVGRAMRLTEQDRICIPVPLYHCFGMVMGNLASVTLGATMVYPGEGFDPLATLQTIEQEKCTTLYGVPTMFIAELDHPDFAKFDLSSLRTGIMAGAPCPIEVMRRVNELMNMRDITIAYGMTETSPVSFQSATDDPLERRVSTVGRIHPHVEVKVVDLEGRIVPRGERGELCTRGYSVMLGYWDEREKTADVLDANGWMHTGDIAIIDDEGFCNIVGRIKDMVIRGGENLYPREIEEFLYRHPKIQDVQIFGVADDRYGEELCAWIRVRPGETLTADEVRGFCHGPDRAQQDPALCRIRRRISDDRDRKDPEIFDARRGRGAAWIEGGEDGVKTICADVLSRRDGRACPGHPACSKRKWLARVQSRKCYAGAHTQLRRGCFRRPSPGMTSGERVRSLANYTGNPFCFASSFSDTCGRAPMCWITSAAASAPRRPAFSWPALRTRPNRKPAANRSPAPVVSTSLSIGNAGAATTPSFETTTQPFSLRVTTPSLVSLPQLLQRAVEIRGLVQRVQFRLVGENQIDRALAHQVEKLVAIAVDAE